GRLRAVGDQLQTANRRLLVRHAAWALPLMLLGTAAFYGFYLALAVATAIGTLTLGTMTLYVLAYRQAQQAFQGLLSGFGAIYDDSLYMANLFDYLGTPSTASAVAPAASATMPEHGIRFENVGFRYPSSGRADPRWALRNVSLFIRKGEAVAL